MSDSYDDYEAKIQLAEQAWEKRVVKTEHDRAVELGQAYQRGWNAALAQREWVPEALRLADALDELDRQFSRNGLCGDAAVELRRLALKQWVGLTDEEIDYQAKKDDHAVYFALGALWAEAKLKEKNT